MSASFVRQRTIVQNAKRPKPFITNIYGPARDAIIEHLLAGKLGDTTGLNNVVAAIQALPGAPGTAERDRRCCIEAIGHYIEMLETVLPAEVPHLQDYDLSKGPTSALIELGGIQVSVRPELTLTHQKGSRRRAGAIKLYLGKNHPLDEDSGTALACVLRHWVDGATSPGLPVAPDRCHVIDVFAERVYTAPRAWKNRMKNVAAACDEIALKWPTV